MVKNPTALARCTVPSIVNLRKIARGTHFVDSEGLMMAFPKRFKRGNSSTILGRADADVVDEDENRKLAEFLREQGLGEAEDDSDSDSDEEAIRID